MREICVPTSKILIQGAAVALVFVACATCPAVTLAADSDHSKARQERQDDRRARRQERVEQRRADFEDRFFETTDQNRDEKVSKEEFRQRADERFKQLDRNGDGYLSREEMRERPRH